MLWAVRPHRSQVGRGQRTGSPHPHLHTHTAQAFQRAAVVWLKGEKEGEIKGRRGGRRGLWRKDRRSKTREVRRKKAPAAPANRFAAMPALPSALGVAEQNATSVGCQAYTEGLWGTGRARRPGCWGPLGPPCPVGRGPVSPQPSISPPSFKSSF